MAAIAPRLADPFAVLREVRDVMEHLRDGGSLAPFSYGRSATYQCPVNVYEDKDAYYVQALLPGIIPDDVQVNAFDGSITIVGEAKLSALEGAKVVWQEFQPFRFQRTVQLGTPFEVEKVQASYRNGVLLLTVPKAEAAKPKTIKIENGTSQ